MDQFSCYECGMISTDQDKVKEHMNKTHGIKVETQSICKSFSCALCNYNTGNMKEFKNHQIYDHKKELHNWMVEDIQIGFKCTECDINFPTQSLSENHTNIVHSDDHKTVNKPTEKITEKTQEEVKPVVIIVPDIEFLTQNTADLKAILEAIPKEALEFEEDVFEKDFKLVLNSEVETDDLNQTNSYSCELCNFRASSKRCLKAHKRFVHDTKFFRREYCPIKTRTELALHYHIDIKHNAYWEVEDEVKEPLQHRQIPDSLKEHFPKNHVLLNIKPDGLCGVTCGSAHIFAQPSEGKDFRRVINKYIVSHWEYCKYQVSFPYERQVGVEGKFVKFNDPMEFQNFLQSPEADFLWTDSEEIQIMCNMYQMGATIVKMAENGKNPPTILHAGPDDDIKKLGLPNTVQIKPGKVPHMYLLLKGAHYDLAVPKDTLTEKYVALQKNKKVEQVVLDSPCNFCKKSFENDRGLRIHMGRIHKDEIRETQQLNCGICEWTGDSKDKLNNHLQEKHIEHIKRKITKEQLSTCYICGFKSSSEAAFQIHTEETHNQIYHIQRETSVTKSPPTKKVKEHHDIEMDIGPIDVVKQKDEEIMVLKTTISVLEQKLQKIEDNMTKTVTPPVLCTPNVKQQIHNVKNSMTKVTTSALGTENVNNDSGISYKESTYKCENCFKVFTDRNVLNEHMNEHMIHTEKVSIPEILAFPYICETCNKGFTHKGNFQNHKKYQHGKPKHVDTTQVKENYANDKTQTTPKIQFSKIHNCEQCGNVFISKPLLEEHVKKSHNERNLTKAHVHDTIGCKCVYPCIPMKSKVEAPVGTLTKQQLHCALQEETDCEFQCENKAQMDDHIKKVHRNKTKLQCTACDLYFENLDQLSRHVNMTHKGNDEDVQSKETNISELTCRNCQNTFNSKNELNKHIATDHISYKPCRNFATNNCDYQEECRFDHTILKAGESICFKCGDRFSKKSSLLSHLKTDHNEPCLKYLQGTCTYGNSCVFDHTVTGVTNVVRNQRKNESGAPHLESNSDFPTLPTTEKRLVGTKISTDQLMMNMNNMITQMSQIMTRMENVMNINLQ